MTETKEPYTTGPDELLTAAQAGEILQMHEESVRRLMRQGKLQAHKYGPRAVRVKRSDIERMATAYETARIYPQQTDQPADVALARNVLAILDNDATDGRKIELLRELAARVINTKGSI